MPDLKVRHPAGLFASSEAKQGFMHDAAFRVALAMESLNYVGDPLAVSPDQVDVQLMPYDMADAKINRLVICEVAGYDFPDRMVNLGTRLARLRGGLSVSLWTHADRNMVIAARIKGSLCSVAFFPMPGNAWV